MHECNTTLSRPVVIAHNPTMQLWQLRHVFGLPSVQLMIENRRRNFIDRLLDDDRFETVLSFSNFNIFIN